MLLDLDTQQHVVLVGTQHVRLPAFAIRLKAMPVRPGLLGVLVLLATQEPAQELALLEIHALQPKPKIAGTVQHL